MADPDGRRSRWLRIGWPTIHVLRSGFAIKTRLFALGAIAAVGLGVFVGALSAIDSLFAGRDRWYDEGKLADLELRVVADDIENFPDFGSVPGVASYRIRMLLPATLQTDLGRTLRLLLVSNTSGDDSAINISQLLAGQGFDTHDPEGVLIDRSVSEYHKIGVGSRLAVKLGSDAMTVHVRGIVLDPEFLLAPVNPSLFVPSKGSLGVLYVQPQLLRSRFGFDLANSLLVRAAPSTDLETLRRQVTDRAITRLNVEWAGLRVEQFGYQFLEKNLGVFEITVPVIVLISVLSAVFVTVFLFFQWVMRERQTLGVLMALGYPGSSLARAFAFAFAGLAVGALAGGLISGVGVLVTFVRNFTTSAGLPMPAVAFSPRLVAWGAAGVAAVFSFAGAVAIQKVFSLSPRDAMRHPIAMRRGMDRVGGWLGHLMPTTWLRVALRNVFRTPAVSTMTIIAVALGFGITASFFISYSSFVGTALGKVNGNQWDLAVDFLAPQWMDEVEKIARSAGVDDLAPYTKGVAQAVTPRMRRNLYIGGFDPARFWYHVDLRAGRTLSADQPDGILLELSSAAELGVGVGDSLAIEVQGRRWPVSIRGLFSGALPGEAHFPIEFHRKISDLDERATGILVRTPRPAGEVERALYREPDVQQVLTKREVARQILAASGQVTTLIRLGSAVSIGISLLFIFASVSYTVLQRRGEYQTLRLIGYGNGLLTTIIIAEVCFLGVMALLLAIPVGALSATYLNGKLSASWFRVETILRTADYLMIFVPGFALLPLVALPIARAVLREPLEVHLRLREVA